MKRAAHIAIALSTLILTLFGVGGVTVVHCACSGKMLPASVTAKGCCATERDCMSISTLTISAADEVPQQVHTDAPAAMLLPMVQPAVASLLPATTAAAAKLPHAPPAAPPLGGRSQTLRV